MAFALWVAAYSFAAYVYHHPGFVSDTYATDVWMICDAVAKCFAILTAIVLTNGYYRQWLVFVFTVAVNNVLDELLFDPYGIGINEAAITVVLACYYTHNICKLIYAAR
jgi:hypothetical protein